MKKTIVFGIVIVILLTFAILIKTPSLKVEKITPSSKSMKTTEQPITTFLVFGDSGTGGTQQKNLANVMLNHPFEFMLHTGDVAYPAGTEQELQDNFFSIYKEHLVRGTFYPSPGNHDYGTDALGPYLKLFDLPKQALKPADNERYYSFDVNNIHFIALDTNTPLFEISDENESDMKDWLENDLNKSGDSLWKVVYFHHPPYSSGKQHGGSSYVRKYLVPTLEKFNVDIVFSGHEHNYERTCLITNDTCSQKGVMYVITGGGGASIYDFGNKEYFTDSRDAQYNFVSVSVEGCKLSAKAIGIENDVLDTFSINKCK